MLAVIIKGNPKYLDNDLARNYYQDIESHLRSVGFDQVEHDAGEDFTRPRQDADLYVAHSRGVGRFDFMKESAKSKFLKFGVVEGVIHPTDKKWQEEVWYPGIESPPPKEHFLFTKEQKSAITKIASKIKG